MNILRVYHGSNHCFKKLKIGRNLVQRRSTLDNEGYGIYFSTDENVCKEYGKYLYTLDINDDYFIDFRQYENCEEYVNKLYCFIETKYNIDINKYIPPSMTLGTKDRMYLGGLAIAGVSNEIKLILDNTEEFFNDTSETKREKIFQTLRNYDKKHLDAYMFNYHIKNIGVIKNVKPDVVQIVSRKLI